jgi:hypothetical protein
LVADAKFLDGSIANAWATAYATTPLTDVLAPLAYSTAPDVTALPAAHLMRMIADSLTSVTFLVAVVDDFLNGVAAPKDQHHERAAAEDWVSRCALHGIHALFPPPDVSWHKGGRDSISIKKLNKGDARWHPTKIMLGFDLHGGDGLGRLIGLPLAKAERYIDAIATALARPRNFIPLSEFQKLHGKVVHACTALPMMRGYMTPLNRVLGFAPQTVGLAKPSATDPVPGFVTRPTVPLMWRPLALPFSQPTVFLDSGLKSEKE